VMLAMQFASDTTMHGIRFLVAPTKFVARRCAARLHGNEHYDDRIVFIC